ncbi:hypothetical protein IF1G_07704 [Cordyceps javanica]|uniref:Uncharacterized protein n=1 Tax=Cordyceps javanica TaxID=43265 RepID=A0A545VSS4_9HYPO|nr:hypothetical protein IF1G_07704 [Cordyceps javanica]TQW04746.1 hypothetical protein IF2G_07975 [Cordyceps javanica]
MEANRYISVTRSEDTAKALTHLSPIACHISLPRIEPEQRARQLQSLTESTTQPRIEFQTRVAKSGREEEEEEQQQQQTEQQRQQEQDSDEHGVDFETREFVLTIGPARDYDHGRAASKATEHTSWPDGYEADKSFAVMALRETLPDTLLKKGLCYWHVKPAAPDAPRDTMRQRLERKQQIPGQMAAAADMPKFSPIPRRRK